MDVDCQRVVADNKLLRLLARYEFPRIPPARMSRTTGERCRLFTRTYHRARGKKKQGPHRSSSGKNKRGTHASFENGFSHARTGFTQRLRRGRFAGCTGKEISKRRKRICMAICFPRLKTFYRPPQRKKIAPPS